MLDIARALSGICERYFGTSPEAETGPEEVSQLAEAIIEYSTREPQRLACVLRAALEDVSRRIDRVSLAVTGLGWLGSGVPAVQDQMISLVRSARREIALCTYAITTGARVLLAELGDVAAQGVDVTLIINGFQDQPSEIQAKLQEIGAASSGRLRLLDFKPASAQDQLHAKVMVVDRFAAQIGSANLSFHGMVSGHELAVVIRGPTAETIASRIDMLVGRTHRVTFP
jgi:phosphatidylserine/phosphatidylglycerophosphate/cardiolipin synthase-like enzyme